MKTLWGFLTDSGCIAQSDSMGSRRMTPVGVILYAAIANSLTIYALVTGSLIGRRAPTMVDARVHSPTLYWLYVGVVGIGGLILDGIVINAWRVFRRRTRAEFT